MKNHTASLFVYNDVRSYLILYESENQQLNLI